VVEGLNIPPSPSIPLEDPFGETKRARDRYNNALSSLRESLGKLRGEWNAIRFSKLDALAEDVDLETLRDAIAQVSESYEASANDLSRWTKCKRIIEAVYSTISPFVKNIFFILGSSNGVPTALIPLTLAQSLRNYLRGIVGVDDCCPLINALIKGCGSRNRTQKSYRSTTGLYIYATGSTTNHRKFAECSSVISNTHQQCT
jgi:hypothetical protein